MRKTQDKEIDSILRDVRRILVDGSPETKKAFSLNVYSYLQRAKMEKEAVETRREILKNEQRIRRLEKEVNGLCEKL